MKGWVKKRIEAVDAKKAAKAARDAALPSPGRKVGVVKLAERLGYNQAYVSRQLKLGKSIEQLEEQAAKRKVLIAEGRGKNLLGVQGRGSVEARAKAGLPPKEKQSETFASAQLRKEIALADQREMENEVRRGGLVPRMQMEMWMSGAILSARDIWLRIGPELRDKLAAEDDPAKIEVMIVGEIERGLRELEEVGRQLGGGVSGGQVESSAVESTGEAA